MNIQLKHIGKSAEDLRFFILQDGQHAGGITVHSVNPPSFSYGIAIAKPMRRSGIAKAVLPLLYAEMRRRGFSMAIVQIAHDNAPSLRLHHSLGFTQTGADSKAITLYRELR